MLDVLAVDQARRARDLLAAAGVVRGVDRALAGIARRRALEGLVDGGRVCSREGEEDGETMSGWLAEQARCAGAQAAGGGVLRHI